MPSSHPQNHRNQLTRTQTHNPNTYTWTFNTYSTFIQPAARNIFVCFYYKTPQSPPSLFRFPLFRFEFAVGIEPTHSIYIFLGNSTVYVRCWFVKMAGSMGKRWKLLELSTTQTVPIFYLYTYVCRYFDVCTHTYTQRTCIICVQFITKLRQLQWIYQLNFLILHHLI